MTEREDSYIAGTIEGGKLAAKKNKELYGDNYYSVIGKAGGRAGHTGGFYTNRELAETAGAVGGRHSRKGYKFVKESPEGLHFVHKDTGEAKIIHAQD